MENNPQSFHVWPLAAQFSLCFCILTSCQPYDPFTEEEVFRGAYERNFVRTFGPFSPNEDWDFTDNNSQKTSILQTKAGAAPLCDVVNPVYEDYGSIYTQVRQNTYAKTDRSFALEIEPDACFSIFPVYQTSFAVTGFTWGLQVFVDGQHLTSNYSDNGWLMGTEMKIKNSGTGGFTVGLGSNSSNGWGVRSSNILHYHNEGGKKIMYMNLVVTNCKDVATMQFGPVGTQQSSLNYQMRILDIPRPNNVDPNFETLFIGCEAAYFDPAYSKKYFDAKRYRTLVLMLVGPKIPKVLYLDNTQGQLSVPAKLCKRYMIEDMGSSSDFDFNDIVVDVESSEKQLVEVSQEIVPLTNNSLRTKVGLIPSAADAAATAIIRHLCGTKPFQVTVGNYIFGRVTDPTNHEQTQQQLQGIHLEKELYFETPQTITGWEPDVSATVQDWDPVENKISIRVWKSGEESTLGGWLVQFPQIGHVPFVMALPGDVKWTEEGSMFTEWQKYVPW